MRQKFYLVRQISQNVTEKETVDPSLGERGTLPSCLALLIFPEVPLGEERLRGVAALASGVGTGSGVLVRRHVFSETALASGIFE